MSIFLIVRLQKVQEFWAKVRLPLSHMQEVLFCLKMLHLASPKIEIRQQNKACLKILAPWVLQLSRIFGEFILVFPSLSCFAMSPNIQGEENEEGRPRLECSQKGPGDVPSGMSLSSQSPLGDTRKVHVKALGRNSHMHGFGFMDISSSGSVASKCNRVFFSSKTSVGKILYGNKLFSLNPH